MKSGIELIMDELDRQIVEEGFTADRDAKYSLGELSAAGACYALWDWERSTAMRLWPWDYNWLKAGEKYRETPIAKKINNLAKAGALIAAEIDRLQALVKSPILPQDKE